jgi:hypothetical protein
VCVHGLFRMLIAGASGHGMDVPRSWLRMVGITRLMPLRMVASQ